MKGSSLRFYMHENQRHRGAPLHEWLLAEAKQRGIAGGSAFRAIAGFGRHGVMSEQHFFELAGPADCAGRVHRVRRGGRRAAAHRARGRRAAFLRALSCRVRARRRYAFRSLNPGWGWCFFLVFCAARGPTHVPVSFVRHPGGRVTFCDSGHPALRPSGRLRRSRRSCGAVLVQEKVTKENTPSVPRRRCAPVRYGRPGFR